MSKKSWSEARVSCVETAATQVRDLVAREMGPGRTQESAMRRVEALYGVPYWSQFGLIYKQPKKIAADISDRIRQAWLHKLERSVSRDIADLNTEIAKGGPIVEPDLAGLKREAEEVLAKIRKARQAA